MTTGKFCVDFFQKIVQTDFLKKQKTQKSGVKKPGVAKPLEKYVVRARKLGKMTGFFTTWLNRISRVFPRAP